MSTSKKPADPDSIIITYLTLRKIIGILAITLPFILVIGSFILDTPKELHSSLSAYYYSHVRNILVGVLCGVSLFLFSYHGYEWKDSLASKLAGFFALGIAFLPTLPLSENDPDKTARLLSTLHYVSSGIFFVILSYMSIFLFTKSK